MTTEPPEPSDPAAASGSDEPGAAGRAEQGATRVPVLDQPEADESTPASALPAQGRAHRFWSRRRLPALLVSLVLLGGIGLLLYDIVAVRAGHKAMSWRKSLADELGERPLDDTWVLCGAGVAAALGLWLLLLALTPGRRSLLPMRRTDAEVRGGLHRDTAALVLRDRVMEVSGVQSARVRMKRRRAQVHAVSHFRELDEVRTDVDAALAAGLGQLGLEHPPSFKVRVRRPGRKG
ncbi:hypothetical protein HUT18_04675 [Streptomyces sp. NA04227]|uniref:DUF6286 domain-containing protein n=1 Tax=Streptomyces sp. NA04227 TaxID=2742136 RepID=UPI00158FC766|nr:DUF6286 domain-containing protein [Streptomyces sp. NA04227]QKW05775.1 hypothetical protein HUT18_04675 [Streptomyces sp. NA04227]